MTEDAKITVRFQQVGFHCWPGAKGVRAYLAQRHRHVFHVDVATWVSHDDREIEFHDLKDEATAAFMLLGNAEGDMGAMSCEVMARALGELLATQHSRAFEVTVWEDLEVGSTVLTPAP